MKHITDSELMDEVERRGISWKFLDDIETKDLERELSYRKDTQWINPDNALSHKLMELVVNNEGRNALRIAICGALGLSNSFAYSDEEIINMVKKNL